MERNIMALAEQQHGLFTSAQLRAAGLTESAVRHRLRTGQWQTLGFDVYRLSGTPRTWEQRLMAAVLAAGPDAAASHRSAAALLGIPGFLRRGTPEVTTRRARRHRAAGAEIHRVRDLDPANLTIVEGVVTTGTPRTLFDLAGVLAPQRTERVLDNCLALNAVTLEALGALIAETGRRGRAGTALLRRLVADRSDGYVPPASDLEARFLALVREAGLVEPVRQLPAGDERAWIGRVDFAYPHLKLVIELDSRRHHTAKLDWEADRTRDNRLMAAGWRVLRVTWPQLVTRPGDVVALLRRSGVTNRRPDDGQRPQFASLRSVS